MMHLLLSTIELRPIRFHFSRELSLHIDLQLRIAYHDSLYRDHIHHRARVRMVLGAQRISIWSLSLHSGDPWPRDLDRRRSIHGLAVVHVPVVRKLHGRVADLLSALQERHRRPLARYSCYQTSAARMADGGVVHGDDRLDRRSFECAWRSMVSGGNLLVRSAGTAFRRAHQQLPRMVFRRRSYDPDFPVPRCKTKSRCRETCWHHASIAVARIDGTGAVCGNRQLRHHDAFHHPRL